jgi:hypothetical protein
MVLLWTAWIAGPGAAIIINLLFGNMKRMSAQFKLDEFLLRKRILVIGLVFLLSNSYGQSVNPDSISSRFNEFSKRNYQEKIYVHTDRNLYLSGEILWFKIYEVGAAANIPLDFSKIAYAEILDKDRRPLMQAKISLTKGSGSGSLYLPADLSSGTYRIRSYTSWMKNFSPDYYFEKPITIVNTLAKPEKPVTAKNLKYDVQFFPEGGNLVEGLPSKVAFRAIDNNGKGVDFNGTIVDENNETIARIRPLKFGIGSFNLTPGKDKRYKALIEFPDKQSSEIQLPQVNKAGLVMSLKEISDKIDLSVESISNPSQDIFLLIHTRQEIKVAEKLRLSGGKAAFQINKSNLGDGISHLTVFNSTGQPLAERLYFKRPASKLSFTVKPDQQLYGKRKKVTLELEAKTEAGTASDADASVSIYASTDFESNGTDIVNYLWLKSDLKGNVEDPAYYFRNTDTQASEALDNLMLTHGWRRFVWEDVVNNKANTLEYLPEIDGHIINAKLTDTRTNSPATGIVGYLSVPGKNVRLYTGRSTSSGDIMFHTRDIFGPSELVAQTNYMQDSTYHIELSSPFSTKFSMHSLSTNTLTDNLRDQLLNQSVASQVQNVYLNEKLRTFYAKAQDSVSFYLKPDKSYLLDNFVRFNTMEEVLREYVSEVSVARQKDDFYLWVPFKRHSVESYKNVEPLLLYDGVPIFDRGNKIVKYDPKKVKSIEVLTKKYYHGPVAFNSIINFKSYKNNLPDFQLDSRATVVDYEGAQLRREFYAPVYETQTQIADRMPDFRNLLYWSPDVNINASGKKTLSFYTSDQKGKYTVVVQGITSSGKPGSNTLTIEVK